MPQPPAAGLAIDWDNPGTILGQARSAFREWYSCARKPLESLNAHPKRPPDRTAGVTQSASDPANLWQSSDEIPSSSTWGCAASRRCPGLPSTVGQRSRARPDSCSAPPADCPAPAAHRRSSRATPASPRLVMPTPFFPALTAPVRDVWNKALRDMALHVPVCQREAKVPSFVPAWHPERNIAHD